ncbi:hypothetical protein Adt_23665 [Abeliophyllum distichum]|uniref:Uncharacterized protein n=1 Tax=Abeliophyllum distichum TaxID=126358 RepID=A0ABD1SBH3_9LAMI
MHGLAAWPSHLGLGHQSACSTQRNKPLSSASPTGTRPSISLFHLKEQASLQCLSHLGLGHQSACSTQRNKPLSSASPTETRPSISLFHPKEQASLQCLSHLGLGHQSACSTQRNKPFSSASPTGTRPSISLFHPKEQASLQCLSHWDSAINQLVPSKGTSLAPVPLPLGLGHQSACSTQRNKPRSSASPTGTRPSISLFLPKEQASLQCLSHWNSAIQGTSLAQIVSPAHQAQTKACRPHKCPPRTLRDLLYL